MSITPTIPTFPLRDVNINVWTGGENSFESRGKFGEVTVRAWTGADSISNQYLTVRSVPPFNGVFKYQPPITPEGIVTPSQFDAGIVFYYTGRAIDSIRALGFDVDHKIEITVNQVEMVNAWYDPINKVIGVGQGAGSDGDVVPHEWGHSHLHQMRKDLLNATNADAYQEFFADWTAITANRDKEVGEYVARLLDVPPENWKDGLRDPFKANFKWSDPNLPEECHDRSLIFSGLFAKIFNRLTHGSFHLSDDQAYQVMNALKENHPHFLQNRATDLTKEDFYWALNGAAAALSHGNLLTDVIGIKDKQGLLKELGIAIDKESVAAEFITQAEINKGAVEIKDKPPDVVVDNGDDEDWRVYAFAGGKRKFLEQDTKLIFWKDGKVVDSQKVTVLGHGINQYLYDDHTLVSRYDRMRSLKGVDMGVTIDPATGRTSNYIAWDDVKKGLGDKVMGALGSVTMSTIPQNARAMVMRKSIEAINSSDFARETPRLVLVDGSDSVKYEVPCGPFMAYVDVRNGSVTLKRNIFID